MRVIVDTPDEDGVGAIVQAVMDVCGPAVTIQIQRHPGIPEWAKREETNADGT